MLTSLRINGDEQVWEGRARESTRATTFARKKKIDKTSFWFVHAWFLVDCLVERSLHGASLGKDHVSRWRIASEQITRPCRTCTAKGPRVLGSLGPWVLGSLGPWVLGSLGCLVVNWRQLMSANVKCPRAFPLPPMEYSQPDFHGNKSISRNSLSLVSRSTKRLLGQFHHISGETRVTRDGHAPSCQLSKARMPR